jgi:transposase
MQAVNTQAEDDKGKGYTMPPAMSDEQARRAKIRQLLERRIEAREDDDKGDAPRSPKASAPTTAAKAPERPASEVRGETMPEASVDATPADESEPPSEQASEASTEASPPSAERSADPLLREAEALKNELTAQLAKLDEAGVDHLHADEPDARMMKGRGTHALGYNAQAVVDHDSDLIVANEVVADQNDMAQMVPMLEEVEQTLGRVADQNALDAGYANGEQLKSAEDRGMNVLVALREEPETKGEYSKAHFRYDVESNAYFCPRGEKLLQIGTNKSHATSQHPDAIYRCNNTTCPVRTQCTKSPRGRQIRRPHGEDARERQVEKQQDPRMRVLLSLRKEIVEHLFGIVKAVDGFRRFTVRGLEKARAQWSLVCTAVNLRKLIAMATWRDGKLVPRLLGAPAGATS